MIMISHYIVIINSSFPWSLARGHKTGLRSASTQEYKEVLAQEDKALLLLSRKRKKQRLRKGGQRRQAGNEKTKQKGHTNTKKAQLKVGWRSRRRVAGYYGRQSTIITQEEKTTKILRKGRQRQRAGNKKTIESGTQPTQSGRGLPVRIHYFSVYQASRTFSTRLRGTFARRIPLARLFTLSGDSQLLVHPPCPLISSVLRLQQYPMPYANISQWCWILLCSVGCRPCVGVFVSPYRLVYLYEWGWQIPKKCRCITVSRGWQITKKQRITPVSYTHLTLPTICSV